VDCNIYLFSKLCKGQTIYGPSVIMDKLSTILIEPKCEAIISKTGDIGEYLIKSHFYFYLMTY